MVDCCRLKFLATLSGNFCWTSCRATCSQRNELNAASGLMRSLSLSLSFCRRPSECKVRAAALSKVQALSSLLLPPLSLSLSRPFLAAAASAATSWPTEHSTPPKYSGLSRGGERERERRRHQFLGLKSSRSFLDGASSGRFITRVNFPHQFCAMIRVLGCVNCSGGQKVVKKG